MNRIDTNRQLEYDATYHINECVAFIDQIAKEESPLILANINGLEIGLCDNGKFIELLNNEIKQAELCLEGLPNNFKEFMFCT